MSRKDADTGEVSVALVNCPLTRRHLIRGALGAGLGFVGVRSVGSESGSDPCDGAGTEADGQDKAYLAAVCGTYCGACPSYIAKHSEDERVRRANPWGDCDGCRSGGMLAVHCRACNIRRCAANKQKVTRCSDCEELPCSRLANLIALGGYPHRKEYLPNLGRIRELGVQEWVKSEERRWRCPKCRLPMSWYDAECARCGQPRSESLFPVSENTPRPY